MTAQEILDELKPMGRDSYKKALFNHGVKEPCHGVKISDLQLIRKRIKKDYQLALDLYETGVYDAMYLAGLIADDARMTKQDLQRWVERAYCRGLCGYTVPWVATGSAHGWELALAWIESTQPLVAAAGWSTLGCVASMKPDAELDLAEIKRLLQRVARTIHQSPDEVRYSMNGFLISVGCHIQSLSGLAKELGGKIGQVKADLGDNDCEVPFAPDYIRKVEERGTIGQKRKKVKC